ncbi:C25 family cysteine peptidase [Reichenbachiella sp. MALMAid0571]|uniref:putative type IX secretion system sortase PorU2 n=1 Tax=Reichenbachiella sp. MALMAid0571 TaxID=3143939 RepID=UPI0032DE997A
MIKNKSILLLITICILFCGRPYARQNFGNEWINYNQQYYKVSIAEDGIYRITFDQLNNIGFPVNTIDPRRIQIFYKGIEQAIYIEGQQDLKFDTSDFIEFYCKKNDGTSDTELYVSPEAQPHSYYNLFSDSSAYFLTYKLSAENGKRMTSFFENNVGSLPAEVSFDQEILDLFVSSYHEGESYGSTNEIVLSQYDKYEGWTGTYASRGQSLNHTIQNITNTSQTGNKPQLQVLLAGGNNNAHNAEIFVGTSTTSLRSLGSVSFDKDENYLFTSDVEWSDVSGSGELAVRATINGVNGAADRMAFSFIRLIYPHNFDLANQDNRKLILKENAGGKSFLRVSNPPANSSLWDITNSNSPIRIGINTTFNELTAVIPNTAQSKSLYLQAQKLSPPKIEQVTFQQISPTNYDYLIISNELLRKNTTTGNPDPVKAYKDYRESTDGGEYDVLLINIDQIYNQFNYGLPSPLAIRKFCDFMLNGGQPKHLFLIGRATNNSFDFYRKDPETSDATNFVPTFGHPGSDIAFTAGLDGTTLDEAIATGRINAKSPDEVEAYLNKVIESENLVYNELWHKNIIHLTGGQNESELARFRSYGNEFKNTAEGPLLGGLVSQTSKKTNDAVEFLNITKEINEGVGLITFFGHSGASVTDIEIGIVSDPKFGYSNKGKYPIFIINGCNAGDFFGTNESFGVDWILTPDLGALGFMAHSSLAFSNNLRNYTNLFYTVAFAEEEFFGKTQGEIKKEVSKRYAANFGTSAFSASQIQQFILQGDPAVKVFAADKPDFDIVNDNIKTATYDGSPLLSEVDSFYVDIDIKNYGKYDSNPLLVSIKRTLPNGSQTVYGPELYDPILRQDTIRFKIDNQIEGVEGNNTFQIILDESDLIDEMDETNNTASFGLFMASGSTFNILPQNYSIINSTIVDFIFQSTDLLSGNRDFLLEIDTIAKFNSSFLIQQPVTENVVAKVPIDLESNGAIPNETVVYWRTKFANPLPSEADEWVLSSFVLKSSGEGWNQSDTDQLNQSAKTGLTFDVNTGIWDFLENNTSLEINIFGPNHPTSNNEDTQLLLDGINFFETNSPSDPGCRTNTLNIIAFDFQSTNPYKPVNYSTADVLNNQVCGKVPQNIYNFTESEFGGSVNPELVIENIKNKDNVLVFSLGNLNYSTWSGSLKTKLTELGISQATLDNLENGEPMIFFGVKGEPQGTATEVITPNAPKDQQEIQLATTISGSFFTGKLTSEKIGPALSYSQFIHDLDLTNTGSGDNYNFSIIGIDKQNNETPLIENIQSLTTDLSSIDVNIYPNIRIQLNIEDRTDLSPLQLKKWLVEYEQSPEGILLKRSTEGIGSPIIKQEGEPMTTNFTFWNLSKKNFSDSIKVHYTVFNRETSTTFPDSLLLKPLAPNDSVNFSIEIQTLGKTGTNDLNLNANKSNQSEVHLNNNDMRLSSFVEIEADQANPILEVSFDGIFILDGDIVSPNPNILISMKDENQYLFKQDTTGINFFLKKPCDGCGFERVAFSSAQVTWQSATENTDFKIDYTPKNLANGMYTLQVQVSDESGNESGTEPYEINFEVINESTITNFYPYPNPFSSSTRFVFTLTGNDIPDDIKIQIMTVTGRVVREILREELGSIRIGNNITDYAWDGRDEYGDQLANGVYLYKVYIKQNGQDITHRQTSADKAFKNGFGKMYLLR